MNNEPSLYKNTNMQEEDTTADRGIIPAEVAARREREGDAFRKTAQEQAGPESIDVTGGATVDQEGLANNYAIEPEMYAEQPGDMRQEEEELAAERAEAIAEMKQDKEGELTMEGDTRGKGAGAV
jgi:hypothetical protein